MKSKILKVGLLVLALLIVSALAAPALAQNVPCYFNQSGNKFVAAVFRSVGCEWEMQSGTTLDIQSGVTETHANAVTFSGSVSFSGTPAMSGPTDFTYVQAADSGAVGDSAEAVWTSPVDTTGTNTHNAFTVDLAIGNATGGTNNVRGLQIDSISGDAQVTETGINIESGWDVGLAVDAPSNFTYVQAIDAGAVGDTLEVAFTSPVDTTGANTHNAFTVDLAIGNSTAGTNNVVGVQIDTITDDAQVVETAINIGDEWDIALDTTSPVLARAQQWFDDFIGDTVLAQYTEASGTDGQALQAIVEEQFGVYQLTSGDAGVNTAGDAEQLSLSLEWQADQGSLIFEVRLHLDTTIANTEICVGLTDNVGLELPFTNSTDTITAVADDAVAFCYDTNATTDEWWALGVDSTTNATGNAATGTAPTADVYQTLRIEIDDGGADCRFYIDGTLAGTLTANCVTPTVALAPVVVISSAQNASSAVVDVDYILVGAARD